TCHIFKSIWHAHEHVCLERKGTRHRIAPFAGDQYCETTYRMPYCKPNGSQRARHFAHCMGTVHEVRLAAGALPMCRKIKQHGPYPATAHIVGKCAHEGCFAGPSMDQKHTCVTPLFGLESIGLNFANTSVETLHVR